MYYTIKKITKKLEIYLTWQIDAYMYVLEYFQQSGCPTKEQLEYVTQ